MPMKRVPFYCSCLLVVSCLTGIVGCSPTGRTTTVTTTREYEYEPRASYARYNRRSPYRDEPTIAERITEPVTDDDGGLFDIVGDVITLPFKLVGAVFDVLL
jgi:hypothetical protein